MKRSLRVLISSLLALSLLVGCASSSDRDSGNIERLSWSFMKNEIEMEIGDTKSGYILVSVRDRDDFAPEDIVFVSEDESVATITYSRASLSVYLYFDIEAIGVGETSVYAVSADGGAVSEKIKIAVMGEETTATTDAPQTEAPHTAAPQTEDMQTKASVTEPPKTAPPTIVVPRETDPPQVAVEPITPPDAEQYTYVLNTSTKKIHKSTCASVKRIKPENYATTTDYAGAIAQGYVQCKNCD